jgi:hypothetical protein
MVELKSKQTAIENRHEQMSSPINNPAYFEVKQIIYYSMNRIAQ